MNVLYRLASFFRQNFNVIFVSVLLGFSLILGVCALKNAFLEDSKNSQEVLIFDYASDGKEKSAFKRGVYDHMEGKSKTTYERLLERDYEKELIDTIYRYFADNLDVEESSLIQYIPRDLSEFTILDDHWARDGNYLYFRGRTIEHIDLESFEILKNGITRDKNNYYLEGITIDGNISPDTVRYSVATAYGTYRVLADSDRVYIPKGGIYQQVLEADPETFEYVGICRSVEAASAHYFKDSKHVYVYDYAENIKPLEQVKASSFEYQDNHNSDANASLPFSRAYAKDDTNVYVDCGRVLTGADSASFRALGSGYAKDNSYVYYLGTIVTGADPVSFEVFDWLYAKDKNHVYHWGYVVVEADPDTFEVLLIEEEATGEYGNLLEDIVYAKDKRHTYDAFGNILDVVEVGENYEVLSPSFTKDENYVYFNSLPDRQTLFGIDAESFEILGEYYVRDKDHFYYYVEVNHEGERKPALLPGADLDTFTVLKGVYAKDKNNVYHYGGRILSGADPATFEMLERGYAKDKNYVYQHSEILKGEDPETFVVSNQP